MELILLRMSQTYPSAKKIMKMKWCGLKANMLRVFAQVANGMPLPKRALLLLVLQNR